MKIVFTTHTFEPYKDGVQAVNKYLTETLVKRGFDVTVITQSHPNAPNKEIINGVNIIRLPIYNVRTIYKGDKNLYRQLIIKETQDANALVNVASQTPWTDWCFDILPDIKCKKILYMHGMIDFNWYKFDFKSTSAFMHKLWNYIRWKCYYATIENKLKRYDAITHLHFEDDAYKYFKNKYGLKGTVIENAAEPEFFTEIDSNIVIRTPKKYAIFVGNYIERKNQEFALRSLYQSHCSKDFGIVFIGSEKTSYYHSLVKLNNELSRKYGERETLFLTNVPRAEVREYVKRAYVCVVGSTWEAYPVAVVESMAAAVPYISVEVGCVKYLPGGVVVKSEYEMSRWLELLESNPECAHAIGKAGRIYSKDNQSVEVCVNRLLALL